MSAARRSFLAAMLVMGGSLYLEAAVAADVAEAPQYKVGDTWKYGRTDLWKNERTTGWTATVAGLMDGRVRIDMKNERNEESRMFLTLDGNFVSGRTQVKPFMPQFSFPLSVGKQWEGTYEYQSSRGTSGTTRLKAKVLGKESITVPAGTFDAFKIEYQAYYTRSDAASFGGGTMRSVYWYAPAAKRIVREEYSDTTPSGSQWDKHVTVLESYTLAPK